MIHAKDIAVVKDIFDRFLFVWERVPIGLDVWHDLLDPVICSDVLLKNGMSLFEAVEPIARMLYYQCYDPNTPSSVGPPCFVPRGPPPKA